ncbi:MAG: DNA internalization-related competence protein ComEC/Rec2 [Deltaproteobacteria bacterium]|nr:DNA internalization-related competence protein ComEC/Rec2 [Deltaproteobacteria bacterium]
METRTQDIHWRRPLAPLAAAFGLGIWLGDARPGVWVAALAGTPGLFAYCVFSATRRRDVGWPLAALFFLLGVLAVSPWHAPPHPRLAAALDSGRRHELSGVVDGEVNVQGNRVRTTLAIDTLDGQPVSGRVRTTLAGNPPPEIHKGDRVSLHAEVRTSRNFRNPGGFDYERFLRHRKVYGRVWAREAAVEPGPDTNGPVNRFRTRALGLISENTQWPASALLSAMVLGDRSGLKPGLREVFARSGLAHLLAVSGLHVGMVAGVVFFLARLLLYRSERLLLSGKARGAAAFFALAASVFYGLAAGMSPSTQRAVVMVGALLLAWPLARKHDMFSAVAAAALALLAFHPPALFSVSFQLSFAAVLAILLGLQNPLPAGLTRSGKPLPPLRPSLDSIKAHAARTALHTGKWLALAACISLLATLGTLPLVLANFHQVSAVGPLTNPLAVPLTGLGILPLGLAAVALDPLWPNGAAALMHWAGVFAGWLASLAAAASSLPGAGFMPVKPSLLEILLFYGAFGSLLLLGRARRAGTALAVFLALLAVDAGWWTWHRHLSGELRVTVLDVGQGTACCVRFPGGKVMMVDGGGFPPGSSLDTGRDIVAPFLWSQKIHHVDVLALSHPQQDHTGGLLYLARRFNPAELWISGVPGNLEAFDKLLAACQQKGTAVLDPSDLAGGRTLGGVKVRVLAPDPGYPARAAPGDDPNAHSLVLSLSLGRTGFLLPGDLLGPGESRLVRQFGEKLSSTVLVAPHHGSASSSTTAFLSAVDPAVVVVPAGHRNQYGFPRPEVLKRYEARNCTVFITGKDGAISLRTKGQGLGARAFQGPKASVP